MSDMIYERVSSDVATRSAASPGTEIAVKNGSKGFWRRFFDRMIEARQRRADEQLRRWHGWHAW